jgi:hypothetical protein
VKTSKKTAKQQTSDSVQSNRFSAEQMRNALAAIAKLPKTSTTKRVPMTKQERSVLQTAAGFKAAARRCAADVSLSDNERKAIIAECVAHANSVYATINRPLISVADFALAKSAAKAKKANAA